MTLRIVILTRADRFFVPDYVRPILDVAGIGIERVYIDQSDYPFLGLTDVLLMSSFRGFVRLCCEKIAAASGRLSAMGYAGERDVAKLFSSRGVPTVFFDRRSRNAVFDDISTRAPDIVVSVANRFILPDRVVAAARLYSLNSHGALLPRHRGLLAGFWSLHAGDSTGGITIHAMTGRPDEGDIFGQAEFPIAPDETVFSYYRKIAVVGGGLWATVLGEIVAGRANPRAQSLAASSMNGKPSIRDILAFRRRGRRFI